MGEQNILSIFLTPDLIAEFSQYVFNMKSLTVSPQNVKMPSQKENIKGIEGPEAIEILFKVVNILESLYIR